MSSSIAVILHGGAGRYHPDASPLKIPTLKKALDVVWGMLIEGEPALNAVIEALRIMEEVPYFNAGYGGYPNNKGVVLLDVGLMQGDRKFISLMNVRRVKFPSLVARDMFNSSPSVLSIWTHEFMEELDKMPLEQREKYGWVATNEEMIAPFVTEMLAKRGAEVMKEEEKHGTVGCVVRDSHGLLASGTSTGGIAFKPNGRVGDSPIIAGGVYADNEVGALSTTGHGEAFLSSMVSGFVLSEMRRRQRIDPHVFDKSSQMLTKLLEEEFTEFDRKSPGRSGALITIPSRGPPAYTFNSEMVSLAFRSGDKDHVESEEVGIIRKGHKRAAAGSGQ